MATATTLTASRSVEEHGIVWATYDDCCKIKDIIGGYDVRHDFLDAQARVDEMFLDDEWER